MQTETPHLEMSAGLSSTAFLLPCPPPPSFFLPSFLAAGACPLGAPAAAEEPEAEPEAEFEAEPEAEASGCWEAADVACDFA